MTASVNFTYDTVYNRVATMVDGTGTTTYTYYPVTTGGTLGATQLATVDGPLSNDTISYSYDEWRCSPFLGPKNSMLKVDRCLLKMG